jgi:hypothetical protein
MELLSNDLTNFVSKFVKFENFKEMLESHYLNANIGLFNRIISLF